MTLRSWLHGPAAALAPLLVAALLGSSPAHASGAYTVTSNDGSGALVAGSLAQAIDDANNDPGSTISFDPSVTSITLSGSLPTVTESVSIRGIEGSPVTISGGDARPILVISGSGGSVTLANLTLTHGRQTSGVSLVAGGAVQATLTSLTVQGCTFSSNVASASGKHVRGGAIYLTSGVLSVSNSVFTGNSASVTGGAAKEASGGAISAFGSPVTISDSTFTGNSATSSTKDAYGGAVYSSGGSVAVSGATTWTANSVTGGDVSGASDTLGGSARGGAIALTGSTRAVNVTGSASFSANTVEAGDAGSPGGAVTGWFIAGRGEGGAIWTDGSVSVGTGATFDSNQARGGSVNLGSSTGYSGDTHSGEAFGGAIAVDGADASSTLSVSGAAFTGNTATTGAVTKTVGGSFTPPVTLGDVWGGAVVGIGSSLTIAQSTFEANVANGGTVDPAQDLGSGVDAGGAVFASAPFGVTSSVTISTSTFSGNHVDLDDALGPTTTGRKGGALYAEGGGAGGTLLVSNSTFTANVATQGSAMNLTAPDPLATSLSSLTVVGNSSPSAWNSALAVNWTGTTLVNSIISGNGVTSPCIVTPASALAVTYTLVDTGTCGTSGAGTITGDPLVDALASNGGPTRTMALGTSSPALLAADSSACQGSPVLGADQRGVARPVGRCDMGAFQRSAPLPPAGGGGGGSAAGSEDSSSTTATATAATTDSGEAACLVSSVTARQGDRLIAVAWTVSGAPCSTTATATPVSRVMAQGPRSCSSTGTGCVISDLVPGVGYSVTVITRGPSGASSTGRIEGPVTAARYVRAYTVVPFAPGSLSVGASSRRSLGTAVTGRVVHVRIAGFADPGVRDGARQALSRADAVRRAMRRGLAGVPIEIVPGAGRDRRCAATGFRCAVVQVTRAETS